MYNINQFSWNINNKLVNLIFSYVDLWSAILLSYKVTMETFCKVSPSFCILKFNFSSKMNFICNFVDINVNYMIFILYIV